VLKDDNRIIHKKLNSEVLKAPNQVIGINNQEIILIKNTKRGDNKNMKVKDNLGNEVSLKISLIASIRGCNKPKNPM
jgi:hypothetical protein